MATTTGVRISGAGTAGVGPPSVPPAAVPLTFLLAAGAGLVGFGLALAAVAPTAVLAPSSPKVVAAVHLVMLAFLSTAVLGAMHQFAPVIGARPLRSARAAYATAVLFVPAVWAMALGFASGHPGFVSAGGATASCGILLAVWNLSGPLSAHGKGTPVLGLRVALGFLVLTAAFGVTYAFDRQAFWFGLLPRRVLAHAHLGLLGWLGVAYVAVAEKLWPMFLLAHRPNARSGDWAVRLVPTGVLVLAAGLLLPSKPIALAGGLIAGAGLAAHLTSLASVIRHRRRPLELLHAFVMASAACLVIAAVAGTVAGLADVDIVWRIRLTSVEVLALAGWLGLAIIGHAHKIVPFIAWSSLRARGVTTGPDGTPLLFGHLFHHPTARATFVAAAAGLAAALSGVATETALLVRFGGLALALSGVLAVTNLGFGPPGRERTDEMSITEPLRREHADLFPHLAELDSVAAGLDGWSSDTAAHLGAIVDFLRGHLVPHARAEEAALYPVVEHAMNAPGATDTMKADHVEIVRRIDLLADTVAAVGAGPASAEQTEQLKAQLYGLGAILRLHFSKEEEVLLPVLDARLSADDAEKMFAAMVAVAHPNGAS